MHTIDRPTRLALSTLLIVAVVALGLGAAFVVAASAASGDGLGAVDDPTASGVAVSLDDGNESAYIEPVPEPGDKWYEVRASDDSWISYVNPRDEYRSPYEGSGSGKIGITLRNETGQVIVGKTVPNTTIVIPTGESLAWHSSADPIMIDLPLTEHYERPLDADQFGTHEDLPQGDGYMDSHTIEWHGLSANATVSYGEPRVVGEHADRIEVVGYIQQPHQSWESDVDPFEDAASYEEAGGEWTYRPGETHGQMIVVLQLVPGEEDDADRDLQDTEGNDTDRDLEQWAALDQLSEIESVTETTDDSDAETTDGNETTRTGETEAASSGWMDPATQSHLLLGIAVAMLGVLVVIATRRR